MKSIVRVVLLCISLVLFAAQSARAQNNDAAAAAYQGAAEAARQAAVPGPQDIDLGPQARLNLPSGFAFIPKPEATRLMQAMGNSVGEGFYGMVVGETLDGFVTVDFNAAGYVKDEDAKDWNADELLDNLKQGTEAGNERRREQGFPEFSVVGWVEKPDYDASQHRLIWSVATQDKVAGNDGNKDQGVNYNTYLLGREGYLELNLVTDLAAVEAGKPAAKTLLAATSFKEGKRYADFNASTDKVAEYGIAALVGGVAAKKLGLFAAIGVFLAKFWKLAALGIFGVIAGWRKWLAGKRGE